MRFGWILSGGLLLAGCASAPYGEKAQYAPEPPPPERAEISGPPETPREVWIAGRWSREVNDWVWRPGFYTRPAGPNRVWAPGHWATYKDTTVWAFAPGSWTPLREIRPLDLGPLATSPDGTPLLSIRDFIDLEHAR